jgi:GT2 family glycosyltransferase
MNTGSFTPKNQEILSKVWGPLLNVSLVLYNSKYSEVQSLLEVLRSSSLINQIFLIDNSETRSEMYNATGVQYIFNNKNIGYGAGHNIAITHSVSQNVKYHLVMNSDIIIDPNVISELYEKMESDNMIGILMPKILNLDESVQLLPKLLPSPLDLLLRVFKPLRNMFSEKYKSYTMQDYMDNELNVPIISGCFSLFRVDALNKIGFYDDRYFMYFEDFDLSRRIHSNYKTLYYPKTSVIHSHERGAASNVKLFFTFFLSAVKYFNKYGWIVDRDRDMVNKNVYSNL